MKARAFLCAEEGGGCGVLWTPTTTRRPVLADNQPWAWCPDCERAAADERAAA